MTDLLAQFVDLDNSQRSEPFAVKHEKCSEILNMLEDYLKEEVNHKRNVGVIIITETDENGNQQISKTPIMKFETFKTVMEQRKNV